MSNHQLKKFLRWAKTVSSDEKEYLNESEVEINFIIEFFEKLGYPKSHRRSKYPIKEWKKYHPKHRGRYPEVDLCYFSTDKQEDQDEETCLVIVEAKKPNTENATEQAKFYGEFLPPLAICND